VSGFVILPLLSLSLAGETDIRRLTCPTNDRTSSYKNTNFSRFIVSEDLD
jgi:hypothetical protein